MLCLGSERVCIRKQRTGRHVGCDGGISGCVKGKCDMVESTRLVVYMFDYSV